MEESQRRHILDQLVLREQRGRLLACIGAVCFIFAGALGMGYLVIPAYQLVPSAAKYGEPLFRFLQAREAFTTWWYPGATCGFLVLGALFYGVGGAQATWSFASLVAERDGIHVSDLRLRSEPGRAWIVRCRVSNTHYQPKHVRLVLGVVFLKAGETAEDAHRLAEWKAEQDVEIGPAQTLGVLQKFKFQPETRVAADEVEALVDITSVS